MHPVASSCLSAVFVFQVFRLFKVPKKFRIYKKNQRMGSFRNNQRRGAGPPPGSQKGPRRGPTLGRAGCPPGCLVGTLDAPFAYVYPSGWKPLIRNPFSRDTLCSAATAVSRSGLPGEAAPMWHPGSEDRNAPCTSPEIKSSGTRHCLI